MGSHLHSRAYKISHDMFEIFGDQTAQPAQPTQSIQTAQTAQPTQPTQSTQTAQTAQPTQPAQPAQPTQSTQTAQTVQPTQSTQPVRPLGYPWNEEFQKILEELHKTPNGLTIYERLSQLGNNFLYAAKVNLSLCTEINVDFHERE
jgi:hypothetical protein